MNYSTQGSALTDDAHLVAAALGGDNDAVAAIYDRYADRIHTMCVHMLSDRDEAADVCGEVFLVAFTRLGQLRDPAKLKSWLFSITRHEVYRRTKQRRRIDLIEEVEEMDRIAAAASVVNPVESAAEAGDLAVVVRDAAGGLDEADRLVLELQLQGLDGAELAAALGTSTSTSYQRVHRMKERLERSIGAVFVARARRSDCPALDQLLSGWDGTFNVLWRKRVSRHVEGCEICEQHRRAVPALLLGGAAVALPMVGASSVSASPAPATVREQVLGGAQVGTGGNGWQRDGFPPADGRSVRAGVVAAAVTLALVAALLIGLLALRGGEETVSTNGIGTAVPLTVASSIVTTEPSVAPTTETMIEPALPIDPPAPSSSSPSPTATQPPVAPPPPPPSTAPIVIEVAWVEPLPTSVFHPFDTAAACSQSQEFMVDASGAESVQLVWTSPNLDGIVEMELVGARWSAVLEVPDEVKGPIEVEAVAAAADVENASPSIELRVTACRKPA